MKKFYLLLAMTLMFAACEKHEVDNPITDMECIAATQRFEKLIAADGEYDITNIESQFHGAYGYWTLDAVCRYNKNYTEVIEVIRPFDLEFWVDDFEPTICFSHSNIALRKYLDKETFRLMRQDGEWSFEPRTLTLSFSFEEVEGYEAVNIKATLKALGQESMVIDYRKSGKCYRASYVRTDIEQMEIREAEKMTSALMSKIADYDSASVEREIIGQWREDTIVLYDDDRQNITAAMVVYGLAYWDGTGVVEYTFKEDGTVQIYHMSCVAEGTSTSRWSFDSEQRILTITSEEGYTEEYAVSGFSSDYILTDCYDATNKDNKRIGLKAISHN